MHWQIHPSITPFYLGHLAVIMNYRTREISLKSVLPRIVAYAKPATDMADEICIRSL
jgi:hypothetical protein